MNTTDYDKETGLPHALKNRIDYLKRKEAQLTIDLGATKGELLATDAEVRDWFNANPELAK